MRFQTWLLFLHLLGAAVWIGGGAATGLIGLRVRRSDDRRAIADFAKTLRFVGLRIFMPALLAVLATGLLMVFAGTHWRFTQAWILIGLAAFLAAFLIGAVYQSRVSLALERTIADPEGDVSYAGALVGRWIAGYGVILLVLVVAVWDMVFKPNL